jgi:hypothetical protein
VDRWHLSGARRVNPQVFGVKSRETRGHEATKWREDQERPFEKDRWRRSKDLANSGARRVRAKHWVLRVTRTRGARR